MIIPIFAKKRYCFNGRREFAKSRKRGHFSGMSPRNVKKGKIVHVCISISLFRVLQLLCINVFQLSPYIRSNENTTYIENVLSLIHAFSLSQKYLIWRNKTRFAYKSVLLGFKTSDFGGYGKTDGVYHTLWGGSTGHRQIPLTKASNAELCYFLWSAPEQTVE